MAKCIKKTLQPISPISGCTKYTPAETANAGQIKTLLPCGYYKINCTIVVAKFYLASRLVDTGMPSLLTALPVLSKHGLHHSSLLDSTTQLTIAQHAPDAM
jgi:hypothetical protein